MSRKTIPDLFAGRIAATPDRAAFMVRDAAENWLPVTWSQLGATVESLEAQLLERGVRKGDRVAILAPNSVHWECAQLASLRAGAVVAGIDPNYAADQLQEVVRSIEPHVLFVGTTEALHCIPDTVRQQLKLTISIAPVKTGAECVPLSSLTQAVGQRHVLQREAGPDPDDEAVMVFSSGTTGTPKPIVFTHGQVVAAVDSILDAYDDLEEHTQLMCWLPLANLFQRVINFCAIAKGATSYVIENPRDLMKYVTVANPHLLIGVPRVFERIHSGLLERVQSASPLARRLVRWGIAAGHERAQAHRAGLPLGKRARLRWALADRLVLQRLRAAFGANLKYFVSGSAPMPVWLLEWYGAIGLPVFEAYGVSESIVPIALNCPRRHKLGTVGQPLKGLEVRLAPDSEVSVRGPGLFSGYWRSRADSDTRFVAGGFWSTGDCGTLDAEGFLTLTGRKSDVFKSALGKWVVPTRVEAALLRIPYVNHALVMGAGRRELVAVLSADLDALRRRARDVYSTVSPSGALSCSIGAKEREALVSDVTEVVRNLEPGLRPGGLLVASTPFSVEGAELTSNLKLRRKAIEAKYAAAIEALYREIDQIRSQQGSLAPARRGIVIHHA